MLRVASIAVVALALCGAATAGPRPPYIDQHSWDVAVCESGGGHADHRAGSYGGAWSWFVSTWQLDRYTRTWYDKKERRWRGMPRYPWNATLRQQYRVFLRSHARGRDFGCDRRH